jgi:hypothetical protein
MKRLISTLVLSLGIVSSVLAFPKEIARNKSPLFLSTKSIYAYPVRLQANHRYHVSITPVDCLDVHAYVIDKQWSLWDLDDEVSANAAESFAGMERTLDFTTLQSGDYYIVVTDQWGMGTVDITITENFDIV